MSLTHGLLRELLWSAAQEVGPKDLKGTLSQSKRHGLLPEVGVRSEGDHL
jgi:hypothetical protein